MASNESKFRDWEAKKFVLMSLYNVNFQKTLVLDVFLDGIKTSSPDARNRATNQALKVSEAFLKWKDGGNLPIKPHTNRFWDFIISENMLKVTRRRLISCSISEFIGIFSNHAGVSAAVADLLDVADLPDTKVPLMPEVKEELRARFLPTRELIPVSHEYNLDVNFNERFEGPHTGVVSGRIQPHHFYSLPEAAEAWEKLVDSQTYPMYTECLLSLQELLETDFWKAAINGGTFNAAVTLGGGGSPEKDWLIAINVLASLNAKDALDYVINDISPFMIHKTAKILGRKIADVGTDRIRLTNKWGNFLNLDKQFTRSTHWRSVVWAILAGTIGNVSEKEFFQSINGPSKIGDLLIVGIDTIGTDSSREFARRMNNNYRSKEVDDFLLTPLNVTGEVEVKVVANKVNKHSDVPNSWTAIFKRVGTNTILTISTRYMVEDFVEYANRFHWEHLGTAAAESDSTFRQLLFRRARS